MEEKMAPITRREVFLAKASGQEVETPTPVTREEVFLDAIAKGGEKFIVTLTPNAFDYSGTMDKTAKEITDAYNAGKEILFKITTFPGFDDVEIPCNSVTFATGYTNGCFHGEIIEISIGIMIVILTGDDNDNTSVYHTTIYSLTPAS